MLKHPDRLQNGLQVVDRTDKELLLKWQRDRNGQVTAGYTWLGIAPSQPPPPAKGAALTEVRVHTPHETLAFVEHITLAVIQSTAELLRVSETEIKETLNRASLTASHVTQQSYKQRNLELLASLLCTMSLFRVPSATAQDLSPCATTGQQHWPQ